MTIYNLKSRFQNLLRPLVKILANARVTANQVTLIALFLSLIWGLLIFTYADAKWPLIGLPIVLFIRMALNAIDGMMAREHNMATPEGALLNELSDVISDTFLYLPFIILSPLFLWPVVFIVIFSIIGEMTGVAGLQIGASRRYDGPLGKSDRAFLFGAIGLLLGLGILSAYWASLIFMIAVLLCIYTVYNRAKSALNELKP